MYAMSRVFSHGLVQFAKYLLIRFILFKTYGLYSPSVVVRDCTLFIKMNKVVLTFESENEALA